VHYRGRRTMTEVLVRFTRLEDSCEGHPRIPSGEALGETDPQEERDLLGPG